MLANQFGDVTTRFHFTTSFVLCAHMCTPSIPCGISLLMQNLFHWSQKLSLYATFKKIQMQFHFKFFANLHLHFQILQNFICISTIAKFHLHFSFAQSKCLFTFWNLILLILHAFKLQRNNFFRLHFITFLQKFFLFLLLVLKY